MVTYKKVHIFYLNAPTPTLFMHLFTAKSSLVMFLDNVPSHIYDSDFYSKRPETHKDSGSFASFTAKHH